MRLSHIRKSWLKLRRSGHFFFFFFKWWHVKNENQSGGRVASAARIWNLREKQQNEKIQREIQRSIRTLKSQDSAWSAGVKRKWCRSFPMPLEGRSRSFSLPYCPSVQTSLLVSSSVLCSGRLAHQFPQCSLFLHLLGPCTCSTFCP